MNTLTNYSHNHAAQYGMERHNTPVTDMVNPILSAATLLLILLTQINNSETTPNLMQLREKLTANIHLFEQQLHQSNIASRTILAARYCLCTALDEAVLGKSWENKSRWAQQSLLNEFHQETWGGERFYLILDTHLHNIKSGYALLELLYVLLSLGFEGKFFGEHANKREQIRSHLYQVLREHRPRASHSLANNWQDTHPWQQLQQKRNRLKRSACINIILILIVLLISNIQSYYTVKPQLHRANQIAQVSPITVYSQLISRNINTGSNQHVL